MSYLVWEQAAVVIYWTFFAQVWQKAAWIGRPVKQAVVNESITYLKDLHQFCADTELSQEDLPRAIDIVYWLWEKDKEIYLSIYLSAL